MKTYWATFVLRLKLELQYRAAALGGLITQLFFGLILIYLYRALYGASADLATLSATATYVWIQQAFFRLLLSSDTTLNSTIRKGDMAYQLVRPVDQYAFWYARILALKLSGSLLRAAPLFTIAFLLPRGIGMALPVSFPAFFAFVLTLLLGLFTISAIETLSSGFILLTLDHRGVNAIIANLTMFMSGNLLPLTLFPDRWQHVIRYLPFSQILDTPIRLYTGQMPLSALPEMLLVQLFWIGALILLGRGLWQHNLQRIVVQGG